MDEENGEELGVAKNYFLRRLKFRERRSEDPWKRRGTYLQFSHQIKEREKKARLVETSIGFLKHISLASHMCQVQAIWKFQSNGKLATRLRGQTNSYFGAWVGYCVTSNAALQAKLMADEALLSSTTLASILKGANGANSPSSIIVAAKEAVKRRVEATSAATKRVENMDAIVRAVELAAEAVSQARKIVTMGDPLSLSDLVETGPEGCWKATRESSQQVGLLKDITRDVLNIDNVRDIPETSHIHNQDISSGDISASTKINGKNSRGPKGCKVSDLVKLVDVVLGSEPEIQSPSFTVSQGFENLEENNIKEGPLVKVFKDGEGKPWRRFVLYPITF
ncbi:hypothetical protein VNO77_23116 [Canavalia gladiata]|uniref:Uncharacterized protein n=1 Tax=Canavalia gladiata TaxID=3824 RepID=A0AAN9L3W2_CANGL